MDTFKPIRVPFSNNGLSSYPIIKQHSSLMNIDRYDSAVTLLNQNEQVTGFRANTFNQLEEYILRLEQYLLERDVPDNELISQTEPPLAAMQDKNSWLQEY